VNSTINAATSMGIAMAVPAVMLFSDVWRHAYQAFGVLAVVTGIAALLYLPGRHQGQIHFVSKIPGPTVTRRQWLNIAHLSIFAGITGLVSSIYWVFAPDYALNAGGLPAGKTAYMWLAVAVGGVLGGCAGDMAARHGHAMSHAFALTVLAASIALLGTNPGQVVFAYGSAAAFGAAYMTLTGFYLVRGIQVMSGHPALGPIVPLIAAASGQIIGAPIAGWLIAESGYQIAFGGFAAFALGAGMFSVGTSRVPGDSELHHDGEPQEPS
jgi:predicted MFS family arabinose efflux permease